MKECQKSEGKVYVVLMDITREGRRRRKEGRRGKLEDRDIKCKGECDSNGNSFILSWANFAGGGE